jgi:hypothetical protein
MHSVDDGSHVAEWEQLRLKVPQEANKLLIDSEYDALARGMPESCLCTYWRLRVRKDTTGQVVQSAVFRSILVTDPATGEIRPWKRADGVVSRFNSLKQGYSYAYHHRLAFFSPFSRH